MIENGQGSIVNISSVGGSIPDITRIGYGVSKAAVNNITQQIALQYARDNIRCNAVLPGLTATDAALNSMPESFVASFLSHVPLNRMGCLLYTSSWNRFPDTPLHSSVHPPYPCLLYTSTHTARW